MAQPDVEAFFDEATNTVSYVAVDAAMGNCAVIDSVLDFDPVSGRTNRHSADRVIDFVRAHGLTTEWVLETHVHADHLSAAALIRERTGAQVGIGAGIRAVQSVFAPMLDADVDDGDFDRLFADGDRIALGDLSIEVLATPGHTPACVSYKVADAVFVGDTLFMPDFGTARTDFPGGDAAQLYRSIQRLLSLPRETRLFMCHDYKAPGRDDYAWQTTVADEAERNVHIGAGKAEGAFVEMRRARDATLCVPKLLYPAIQVNIRGGRLPPPDAKGMRYLKIPIEVDGG